MGAARWLFSSESSSASASGEPAEACTGRLLPISEGLVGQTPGGRNAMVASTAVVGETKPPRLSSTAPVLQPRTRNPAGRLSRQPVEFSAARNTPRPGGS